MVSIFTANNADAYQQHMGRWSRRLAVGLVDFAAIDEPGSILDVGCGTGSLTYELADRLPRARLTGLDFSENFVGYARAHAPDGDITFVQGDAAALPYADQSFDHALSLLVLNFIPDHEKAVAEIARVTRVGGVIAAAVWDFRGGVPYQRMLFDTAAVLDPGNGDTTRAKIFSMPLSGPGDLATAWRKVGLRDVTETSLTIRMEFESFADYWKPFLGGQNSTGAYVKGLSDEMRTRIEHHVRLAYLAGGEDGFRSFASTAWAVRGIR